MIVPTATILAATLLTGAPMTTVLAWHADKTQTMARDASGHQNAGTLHRITQGAPGHPGHSFGLIRARRPAHRSYIEAPAAPSLDPGRRNLIYGATIRIDPATTINHDYRVLGRGRPMWTSYGASWKLELVLVAGGAIEAMCRWTDTAGVDVRIHTAPSHTWSDGRWHRLRCTKTATAVAVTVDQTTVTAPARLGDLDTSAPLLVGVEPITTTRKREQLVGSVDNVVVRVGTVAAKDTP